MLKLSVKRDDIYYSCEWSKCEMVFDDDEALSSHVLNHVQEVIDKVDDDGSEATCLWCHCAVEQDTTYIVRHLYYHAFHTKLMSRGAHIAKKMRWPRCRMDPSNRLVIPIIPGPFMCGWRHCDFQSNNVDVFYKHVAMHPYEYQNLSRILPGVARQCHWDDCKHVSTHVDKLVRHLNSHTREREVACHLCGDMFYWAGGLRDHLLRQAVHAPDDDETNEPVNEFTCLQCGRVYASEKMLRDHLRLHVNVLKCDQCDMTCSSKYALKRHILYKHTTSRPFPCKQCSYSAKSSHDLLQHVQLNHERTKPAMLSCKFCNYACKHSTTMKKHMRLAHAPTGEAGSESTSGGKTRKKVEDRPYACHLCPRRFGQGKILSVHLRNKHGLRLPPGFSKFTYRMCEDGLHRLQTVRIDSLEVIQQMVGPQEVERLLQTNDGNEAEQQPATQQTQGNSSSNSIVALPVSTVAYESMAVSYLDLGAPTDSLAVAHDEPMSEMAVSYPSTSNLNEDCDTHDCLQLPLMSPAGSPKEYECVVVADL